jgi:hypothetical protein
VASLPSRLKHLSDSHPLLPVERGLQAALALARLWSSQGKREAALQLLQPVYGWFTEGRSTKDHLEAAALLGELQQVPISGFTKWRYP